MVALDQYAHEIVVTESFLELVCFDKHRVALDKVAVPRRLDVDFFHAHDRNRKQNDKRHQENGAVVEQEFAKTAEPLVDSFNVNLWKAHCILSFFCRAKSRDMSLKNLLQMVLCKTEQFLNPFGLFVVYLEFFLRAFPGSSLAGSGAARLRLIEPLRVSPQKCDAP